MNYILISCWIINLSKVYLVFKQVNRNNDSCFYNKWKIGKIPLEVEILHLWFKNILFIMQKRHAIYKTEAFLFHFSTRWKK